MEYYSFYGGLSITDNRNLKIRADGYGNKGVHEYSCFYADFMFAPYIKIDDFIMDTTKQVSSNYYPKHIYKADGEGGFVKKNIGWRVGMFYRNGALDMTLEVGSRPGVVNKGGYALITFGVAIPVVINAFRPGSSNSSHKTKKEKGNKGNKGGKKRAD